MGDAFNKYFKPEDPMDWFIITLLAAVTIGGFGLLIYSYAKGYLQ